MGRKKKLGFFDLLLLSKKYLIEARVRGCCFKDTTSVDNLIEQLEKTIVDLQKTEV